MDKIRIPKVEDVTLWKRGIRAEGTLHLTPHHLVFSWIPLPTEIGEEKPTRPKEIWITYPMIQHCVFRPVPQGSHQQPSLRVRCRDFTFVAFHFLTDAKAREAFETIRNLSCRLGRLEKLYAFTYQPPPAEKQVDGWKLYDAAKEWERQGVGRKGQNQGWRISNFNVDYQYSPTYPALLPVPATISDNVINYAGRYRSRVRIPVLTYLHPVNDCSITRSSQPLVGVRGNRSVQDEKLVAAIFSTSKPQLVSSTVNIAPSSENSAPSSQSTTEATSFQTPRSSHDIQAAEDAILAPAKDDADEMEDVPIDGPKLYGAQQKNLIVDARPTVNALAMQAVGLGSENMDYYSFATKAYLGIDNIHVMRDSLNKVIDALKDSDVTPMAPNREQLAKSGWLKHMSNILDGAGLIARQVGIHHSHVLIHCSDGWDRTSQLSALSQLCLDPYFRTLDGFIVLVEKDWLSFGHMFRNRSGFLGCEKWFDMEHDRVSGNRLTRMDSPFSGSKGVNIAFESALHSAKGFFNKHNESRESLGDQDGDLQAYETSPRGSPSPKRPDKDDPYATKPKEISPVFHQFLDATYQMIKQYPTRFEFNERFLRRLLYQLYSCQYGTFLYNSEKERHEARAKERTRSVWDYFLARRAEFTNLDYDATINDNQRGQERLLFPRCDQVRWWAEAFGRTDEEMNKPDGPIGLTKDVSKSTLTGIETNDMALGTGTTQDDQSNGHSLTSELEHASSHTGSQATSLVASSGSTSETEPEPAVPASSAADWKTDTTGLAHPLQEFEFDDPLRSQAAAELQ